MVERHVVDETDRQYEEVFAKIDKSLAAIFPGETRENVARLVQGICEKLQNGERVDFASDEGAKKALAFIRDVKERLADAVHVPV